MILFLKHIDIEGPGTILPFFESLGNDCQIVELGAGEKVPKMLDDLEGVVILGGPMNVYEEDKYSFLKEEDLFIKSVLDKQIPLLGICLGSQLIAKAAGAQVKKAPHKEIGWSEIKLSDDAKDDPIFKGSDPVLKVFQWHEDTFDIPKGARLLAGSTVCAHQAFCLNGNAYGLQFHIEITDEIIKSWIERYFKVGNADMHEEGRSMLEQYAQLRNEFNRTANNIYKNFTGIIKNRNVKC